MTAIILILAAGVLVLATVAYALIMTLRGIKASDFGAEQPADAPVDLGLEDFRA